MALKEYSPELLRMVYLLGITKKRLFGKELEDYLVSNLHIESSRTIYRYMKKLRNVREGEHTFDYYPSLNYSNLGLMKVEVLFKEPSDLKVVNIIPHTYWAGVFIDRDFNKILKVHYLIPPESYQDFLSLIKQLPDHGFSKEVEIFILDNGKYIPSPFHDIITINGELKLNGNTNNSELINKIKFENTPIAIDNRIKNNPILIPILFESDKESSPHERIHQNIKKKLGMKLPDYFNNDYNKFPSDPESGGPYIQNRLQDANDDFERFFDHVRVFYKPLHELEDVHNYAITIRFQPEEASKVKDIITGISNRSLFISSYIGKDINGGSLLRISMNTTFNQFMRIMVMLKEEKLQFDHYTLDQKVSWYLWNENISKFNYWDLFDPIDLKWIFDQNEYMKNIEK
jgi:hypothetical protein